MPENDERKNKVAVILCGCGSIDGSEIYESTFALAALDENNLSYQCFAPDLPQGRVINFLDGKTLPENRNQLMEAARIARGNIKELSTLRAEDFDALVIPGGFGVAYNLCDFAEQGVSASVIPPLVRIIRDFHAARKPIGVICIAPVLIAIVLGKTAKPFITAGDHDNQAAQIYQDLGCQVKACSPEEYLFDAQNLILSTPAYMNAKRISQVKTGIFSMLSKLSDILTRTA